MDYKQFITEIQKYWNLYSKGLKKQANYSLFEFTKYFKSYVTKSEADNILFQFCKEYIDEVKFPDTNLPFQIRELLNHYFFQECKKNKMPQMRWAFQIFGEYYNTYDTNYENNTYNILEQAYKHKQCDPKTVELYFNEQLKYLWWGQHHFPEYCTISNSDFEHTIYIANKILSEKSVAPSLIAELEYYIKLYNIYFMWEANGKTDDFYKLCNTKGIEYQKTIVFYYKK